MSRRSYFRRRQVAFGVVELYSNKCRARFERFTYHQRQTRSLVSVTYLIACKQARRPRPTKAAAAPSQCCKGTWLASEQADLKSELCCLGCLAADAFLFLEIISQI